MRTILEIKKKIFNMKNNLMLEIIDIFSKASFRSNEKNNNNNNTTLIFTKSKSNFRFSFSKSLHAVMPH